MNPDPSSGGPRLRFAPSPTGYFHVGGARTALWNWLVARRTGGTFILRIEDTDAERNRPEWTEGIQSAMRWLGLDWDEGPYFQSDRGALYANATARLHGTGLAYFCDCTREAIDGRASAAGSTAAAGYDGFCRDRALDGAPGRALRFRTPRGGATTVVDLIRGEPVFENRTIEDFVVQRGDGSPTFILANVVDDLDMGVTHVVRGEEHLPNTPKAILLWQALAPAVPLPVFAHVAVLVNEKRQKLSKRRDKVALEHYRAAGFLAEAMRNYLVLLGWAPEGDREILTVEEMIAEFRLEDVSSSPAFFDVVKLTHFNGEYIRALPVKEFVARCEPWLTSGEAFPATGYDPEVFARIAPFVQQRAKLLADVAPLVDFLFLPEAPMEDEAWDKAVVRGPSAAEVLDGFLAGARSCAWEADSLKALVEHVGAMHGLKLGTAQAPVRVAVTGRTVGPPLFESLEVLGREASVARARAARDRLG